MTAQDLHAMAAALGVNLDSPTAYDLDDDGRGYIFPRLTSRPCPFGCGQSHGTQGSSCPFRRVTTDQLLALHADAPRWWRRQVMRRA